MPSYSGKRTYEMATKKWGGRNQRRDERRSTLQNRIGVGSRHMVSPWENGVAPGMQSSLLGQSYSSQSYSSSYLLNSGMNRQMGAFDDQRGRGLLPNPTPLLGVAPQAFPPPSRGSDFLQQRMGGPWDSSALYSGGARGMNSGYYPSNRGRQDNSRRFLKAKRPQNKSSNSSSSGSKGSGPKEGRGNKAKGATTNNSSNKSPSKGGEDKDKDSSSNKSGKQGESPLKRERSDKGEDGADGDKEKTDVDEEGKTEEEEGGKGKEGADDEEKGELDEKKKEDKEKQQEDTFPVKALYCHICELDSFSSKKGYIRHLQGITHAKMAEVYHAKNAATLELLNISAKLAEMRQRDKVLRRTGKKGQPVMKTTEQILVQKWLKVGSCCGQKYKSPFGLEEHKLSIHHLKAKYVSKHKDGEERSEEGDGENKEVKKEEGEDGEDSHDDVVRNSSILEKALKEAEENPTTMNSLPVYNPSTMIGLEFVNKELRFRCRVCKGQAFKSLENHCQSHTHFDNIATHLNKEEDRKREEKRKQDEAEAAAKVKKEKEEKEKEKEKEKERAKEKMKEDKEADAKMEEGDEGDDGELPEDYITLDDAKDKSDEEEMDEDVIPLGEEEERILNAKEDEEGGDEEEQESQLEDSDAAATASQEEEDAMESAIFEEIGEKIDFESDIKRQMENGGKEGGGGDEEDESQNAEEVEAEEPPQKRSAYTPRRRGKSRSRGRANK